MEQEPGPGDVSRFEIGNSVVYGKRVWEVKDIKGDTAEIHARESTGEITANSLKGGHTREEVAAEWGGVLKGEPYPSTSPDGESFMCQKVFFPEQTEVVKLSDLKHWNQYPQ